MKTKAAFTSLLSLALATTILAGSTAEAQMKTKLAPRKTAAKGQATSQLKAKVATAAPAEEKKSPFSLNIAETFYGKAKNEENNLEHWITGSVTLMENVSFSLESGFDTPMENRKKNSAYDLEANLGLSGIEVAKDFTLKIGLIGVLPTSRGSRDANMIFGYGARANFGLKFGGVSLGVDNNFYQFAYKEAPIATPEADLFEGDEKRFYSGEFTRATTILSAGIPVGPITWKNDLRIRQSTPYEGEEKRPMRFRTRLAYDLAEGATVLGGVYWSKDMNDKKGPSYFDENNRTIVLQLSLDV